VPVVWLVTGGPKASGVPSFGVWTAPLSLAASPLSRRGFSLKTVARPIPCRGKETGSRAYNHRMFDTLQQLAATAFMERLTLWLNHVLAGEDAAVQRLRPHAGRSIRLQLAGWPSLLPAPPDVAFTITRAGLLEWRGADPPPAADLRVTVDASNPALMLAQGLTGRRPAVEVAGDALLAADVSWLMDNLRWDVQDDLARFVGPAAAHQLARVGSRVAGGLRDGVAAVAGLAGRGAAPEPSAR
jgi:ubiquinone biosynthesis protein UbiJ